MELIATIGMLIAKANGVRVPGVCWIILVAWAAFHLAIAWFGLGFNEIMAGGVDDE